MPEHAPTWADSPVRPHLGPGPWSSLRLQQRLVMRAAYAFAGSSCVFGGPAFWSTRPPRPAVRLHWTRLSRPSQVFGPEPGQRRDTRGLGTPSAVQVRRRRRPVNCERVTDRVSDKLLPFGNRRRGPLTIFPAHRCRADLRTGGQRASMGSISPSFAPVDESPRDAIRLADRRASVNYRTDGTAPAVRAERTGRLA
jgi:hypothetical protein